MESLWHRVLWGNTVQSWTWSLLIIIGVLAAHYIIKRVILRRLQEKASQTETIVDDIFIAVIENIVVPLLMILIFYWVITSLTIPAKAMARLKILFWIMAMYFILRSVTTAIRFYLTRKIRERTRSDAKVKQANGLIFLASLIVWIGGFVFLLDNLGFNISTLLAGLGIGGIAIALATQTILGDLFAYFVIYFDKPFEIGDFISFDDKSGTIERIGLKSTHLRVASGEQLITSNKYLTDIRVHNFGRMQTRLIIFRIKVVRWTKPETLKQIPALVQQVVETVQDVKFENSHFVDLGTSAFEFEIVYRVQSASYAVYQDRHQEILYRLINMLDKNDIRLAYPTESRFVRDASAGSSSDSY